MADGTLAPEPDTLLADLTVHAGMLHDLAKPLAGLGKLIVASYGQDPAPNGPDLLPKVEHFTIGDVAGMVQAIQRLGQDRHRNVYVPLAVMRADLPPGKKGTEADIVGVLGLVADFDDTDAADYARRLPVTAPYVLETSAARFQAFLPFNLPAPMAEAKAVAVALKQHICADYCSIDMSHVWRVPGLLNWPNRKKVIEYGRSPEPQPVRVAVPWDGSVISVEELRQKIPVQTEKPAAKELPTTDVRQNGSALAANPFDLPSGLIERMTAALAEGQRSENAYFVMKALHERGWSVNAIVGEIQKYPAGVGERYVGREKQLRADVERVVAKPGDDRYHHDAGRDAGRRPNGATGLTGKAGNGAEGVKPRQTSAEPGLPLADFLSSDYWRRRALDLPEPLLGELIVNTTRLFLGGPTGLGKTHLIMAMAGGMAAGAGFLHWTAVRPARVLMIDGEMPRDLVQERLNDLYHRMGVDTLPNLFVFCREDAEELAEQYPELGEMQPLNTEAGRKWLLRLIDIMGSVDVVILDNRMSLLSGDMKDEVPWTDTMPLVKELTGRRIAQIWIDHTGHDTSHIYGTKTKEWQFDTVAMMEKAERPGAEIAFTLSFSKARRRKPSNRADFDTVTVTLKDDAWSVDGAAPGRPRRKVTHMAEAFHTALANALVITPTPDVVTRDLWYAEAVRLGLADPIEPDDSRAIKNRKKSKLRKYMAELKAANWIGVNGDEVESVGISV